MVIEKIRNFLATSAGKVVSSSFLGLAILFALFMAHSALTNAAVDEAGSGTFIDAETKQPFHHQMRMGESVPVVSPSGGKGYPAEMCNWTADGHVSAESTPVLMNQYIGVSGPTYCPTCGRIVVLHNEPAAEGVKPPFTKEESQKVRR